MLSGFKSRWMMCRECIYSKRESYFLWEFWAKVNYEWLCESTYKLIGYDEYSDKGIALMTRLKDSLKWGPKELHDEDTWLFIGSEPLHLRYPKDITLQAFIHTIFMFQLIKSSRMEFNFDSHIFTSDKINCCIYISYDALVRTVHISINYWEHTIRPRSDFFWNCIPSCNTSWIKLILHVQRSSGRKERRRISCNVNVVNTDSLII